jgi:hypothetical protein
MLEVQVETISIIFSILMPRVIYIITTEIRLALPTLVSFAMFLLKMGDYPVFSLGAKFQRERARHSD